MTAPVLSVPVWLTSLTRVCSKPTDKASVIRRYGAVLCAGSLSLASLGVAAPALAAEPDVTNLDLARNVAVTGREAFNVGDYETALALFRRAYALFPAPTIGLYEARTLEKMGLLIEAVETYSRMTRLAVPASAPLQFAEAIDAAREEGETLRARIPMLTLELRGAGAEDASLAVTVNGRAVNAADLGRGQNVNPGTYHIVVMLGGEQRASADVTLVPGQSRRVELNVATTPEHQRVAADGTAAVSLDSGPGRRIPALAYVAGGVGIVGVTTGVITGLLANDHYADAEELCESRRCQAGTSGPDAVDAFRTWRLVSSVSYGVGAAGIAAGVVLWLTASDDSDSGPVGSIEPWGTAKAAGIRGTF
jgi:hypothetical protein